MAVVVVRYSERPELWDRVSDLSSQIWPECNLHGDVTNPNWGRLYDELPEFQFVLYGEEADDVLAEGHTIPCAWDGTPAGVGPGIDDIIVGGLDWTGPTLQSLPTVAAPRSKVRKST